MRLSRLDLDRYGRFTDTTLPLPRQTRDLHVIYGPNEAGKSTTRKALAELLFGFELRTPYNFLHDYQDLRLRALVEGGDAPMEVVRRKTNKASLIDPVGQPIDDDLWQRLLGQTDRVAFERMFALDHSLLVKGAESMLDSRSDAGRVLFQAAAGLSRFNQVRADLGAEAAKHWSPGRARKDVRFFDAKARVEAAARALREHAMTETALGNLQRDAAQAEKKAIAARTRRHKAHVRIAQLERIRRVAPKLQQLALLDVDIAAAEAHRLLADDARDQFRTATQEIAAADSAARELAESIDDQLQRRDALTVDDALLTHARKIDALSSDIGSVEKEAEDIPRRKVEREQLRRQVTNALADLGYPVMEPSEVPGRLPRTPQRERLRVMAVEAAEQQKKLAGREAAVETARGNLADLRLELLRDTGPSDQPWAQLIATGAAVLESANARQLADAVAAAEHTLRLEVEAMGWSLSPEGLREAQPPTDAQINGWLGQVQDQQAAITELIREQRTYDAELEQVTGELELRQREAVPDLAALVGARLARDEMLGELISGARPLSAEGDAFRDLVNAADAIADSRYADAEAAATLDALQARQAGLRARANRLADQLADATGALDAIDAKWQAATSASGMPGVPLTSALEWSERRRRVLDALDSAERARAADAAFSETAANACTVLASALQRPPPAGLTPAQWLQNLVREAREVQQGEQEGRVRRTELAKRIEEQEQRFAREQGAVEQLVAGHAAWRQDWDAACAEASLPPETVPGGLDRVLESIEALRSTAERFAELVEARIEPMQRNVTAFQERVRDVVAAAAPDLADRSPFDAVRALARALQSARDASTTRHALDASIETQRAKHRLQVQKRELALARLAPLLEAAGVTEAGELDFAVTDSDRRRALEASRTQLVESILEHGEGRDLEALRAEVGEVALDQLEILLAEESKEHSAAEEAEAQTQGDAARAKDKLQALEGDEQATQARASKAAAQREMADAVDAFVGLQTQSLMLDWALKRYREEKQGPLLHRASEYFSKLTLGEHVRLLAEEHDSGVSLYARRAGDSGCKIGLEAMSEGTRDQLYLALRLAALELHLARNVALPFVADDLLVNFDDRRAAAALGCLADLSEHTQVLYFTHHRHLLDLAREAVGGDLNVIELA